MLTGKYDEAVWSEVVVIRPDSRKVRNPLEGSPGKRLVPSTLPFSLLQKGFSMDLENKYENVVIENTRGVE